MINKCELLENKTIKIGGSKSISNRLLILQKLFSNIEIQNLGDAQDVDLLKKALSQDSEIVDIHHAGTAMRFLTSYFSIQEGKEVVLTGSDRMKQRPIKPLVDALLSLGASIEYLGEEGYPPLKIRGKKLDSDFVEVDAQISSQFITSLMLIGAKQDKGLKIKLKGKITSKPYLMMTLGILNKIGIETAFVEDVIEIKSTKSIGKTSFFVESDWSSASYFYSLAAIGRKTINLQSFVQDSIQGDSALQEIYLKYFGIKTVFESEGMISLLPVDFKAPNVIELDMNDCPDIAQTVCVTASVLKIPFKISGLETLKVKETDRLVALQNELLKIGAKTKITDRSIESELFSSPQEKVFINTYKDHRMAMAFAPYALVGNLEIEDSNVVEKSYPKFWKDFHEITR